MRHWQRIYATVTGSECKTIISSSKIVHYDCCTTCMKFLKVSSCILLQTRRNCTCCKFDLGVARALQKTVNGPNPLLALLSSIFIFTGKDYLQILPLVIKARKPMESFPTGSKLTDWHCSGVTSSLHAGFLGPSIIWSCKSDCCLSETFKKGSFISWWGNAYAEFLISFHYSCEEAIFERTYLFLFSWLIRQYFKIALVSLQGNKGVFKTKHQRSFFHLNVFIELEKHPLFWHK